MSDETRINKLIKDKKNLERKIENLTFVRDHLDSDTTRIKVADYGYSASVQTDLILPVIDKQIKFHESELKPLKDKLDAIELMLGASDEQ